MNVDIIYSKQVSSFLLKNSDLLSEEKLDTLIIHALKKIYDIEDINIDLKRLKGKLTGFFRIRKGNIRIIFSIAKKEIVIVFVRQVDFRGNIY
jgi:mRNA interferase RelE/StbE